MAKRTVWIGLIVMSLLGVTVRAEERPASEQGKKEIKRDETRGPAHGAFDRDAFIERLKQRRQKSLADRTGPQRPEREAAARMPGRGGRTPGAGRLGFRQQGQYAQRGQQARRGPWTRRGPQGVAGPWGMGRNGRGPGRQWGGDPGAGRGRQWGHAQQMRAGRGGPGMRRGHAWGQPRRGSGRGPQWARGGQRGRRAWTGPGQRGQGGHVWGPQRGPGRGAPWARTQPQGPGRRGPGIGQRGAGARPPLCPRGGRFSGPGSTGGFRGWAQGGPRKGEFHGPQRDSDRRTPGTEDRAPARGRRGLGGPPPGGSEQGDVRGPGRGPGWGNGPGRRAQRGPGANDAD